MPGARRTGGLVRKWREWVRARAYRLSGGIRHPLRNGFTAYAALSSATNSSCHRRRRIARQLDPVGFELSPPTWHQQRVSGPHGFAVRYNVVRPARLHIAHEVQLALRPPWRADALASTTSHPAFVTTRDRPSCRNGTAGVKPLIWGRREAQFCPSRHSAAACRAAGRRLRLSAQPSPSSFRDAPFRRGPGIHNHHREYGFRARAISRPGMTACGLVPSMRVRVKRAYLLAV